MIDKIKFGNDYPKIDSTDVFSVSIDWKMNEQDILSEFAAKLQFPDYFGENWDALFDCLLDYDWIEEHYIVIGFNEVPRDFSKDLYLAIELLVMSIYVFDNKNFPIEDHIVYAVLPESFKPFVEYYIEFLYQDPTAPRFSSK